MNYKYIAVLFFCGFISFKGHSQNTLQYSSFIHLNDVILKNKQDITVLNFWATWCKPCVAELPDFEKINTDFEKKNVKVILANLDFHSQADTLVSKFIKKNNLKSQVIHITDIDPNDWINKIDSSWTGSIPVTAIYYKGEKVWFIEGPTDYEQLNLLITKYLKE